VLCSKCSERVRPVVAIDIDGTLGDYHTHFIDFACRYLDKGWPLIQYHGQFGFKDWFRSSFLVDERTFNDIKLAYRQGAQKRSMPVISGSRRLVRWLNENSQDLEVWVTTTRPYMRHDMVDPDTRFWLEQRLGLNYYGLLYDEDKYQVLAERVNPERVIAIIDDLEEQLQAANSIFGFGMAIKAMNKFNSYTTWDPSMTIGNMLNMLEYRLHRWENEHGR
jgi:hypothetical protein